MTSDNAIAEMELPGIDCDLMTKSAFARHRGVVPGRVTQWISEGKICGDALVGEGRGERIRLSVAERQLSERLDIGQNLNRPNNRSAGNSTAGASDIDSEYKRLRVERAQIDVDNARLEQKAKDGLYTLSADASAATGRVVTELLNMIDGAIPQWADHVASQLEVESPRVLHALRQCVRETRASAAAELAKRADRTDQQVDQPTVAASET